MHLSFGETVRNTNFGWRVNGNPTELRALWVVVLDVRVVDIWETKYVLEQHSCKIGPGNRRLKCDSLQAAPQSYVKRWLQLQHMTWCRHKRIPDGSPYWTRGGRDNRGLNLKPSPASSARDCHSFWKAHQSISESLSRPCMISCGYDRRSMFKISSMCDPQSIPYIRIRINGWTFWMCQHLQLIKAFHKTAATEWN